ncbi:MAG: amidohydrolase [Xanthomonadales bacterium]|nr:amidohydrolase [Xanthomonadales bacterium]
MSQDGELRLRLVQAELYWRDPARNRERLGELALGAGPGADRVVLPETFTTGFLGDEDVPAEGMDGPTVQWMVELAKTLDAAVCGSAVIVDDGGRFNRFLVAGPEGMLAHYDKRHLFGPGGEQERYEPGRQRVVFDWRGWRICPQVCYDLRVPAWCRNRGDYDLLVFVANWPAARVTAWKALARARAIENQACVVAVNRVGTDGRRLAYPGQSCVFDAMGEELAGLADREQVADVALDLVALRRVREELPFLADADRFEITGP